MTDRLHSCKESPDGRHHVDVLTLICTCCLQTRAQQDGQAERRNIREDSGDLEADVNDYKMSQD